MYVFGPIFDYFSLFRKFDRKFQFCPKFPKFSKFSVRFEQGFRPFSLACFAKIFGLFSDFRNSPNFGISYRNENGPEISFRNFRFRTVIFAKFHRTSKLLAKRSALVLMLYKRLLFQKHKNVMSHWEGGLHQCH